MLQTVDTRQPNGSSSHEKPAGSSHPHTGRGATQAHAPGIAKAIKEGHLQARRYGRLYLIEPSALERYRATRKRPGDLRNTKKALRQVNPIL